MRFPLSTARKFDLPPLPPRPGRIGDLARQLLLEGDLTAFRPLQDALLEADRSRDARILQQYLAQALIPPTVGGHRIARPCWPEFAQKVFQLLLFDLFEPDSVLQEFEKKCEETRAVTQPGPRWSSFPEAMSALRRRQEELKEAEHDRRR